MKQLFRQTQSRSQVPVADHESSCLIAGRFMAKVVAISKPKLEAASNAAQTSVFDFEDYRLFLKSWLRIKKATNPSYSGTIFAKRSGLQSHSLLGMVIRGDRNLTYETIRAFSRGLELSSSEALFFEKLVLFNQAKHPEDQSFYLEQLLTVSKGRSQNVFSKLHDFSEFLSHWYIVAIKELMELKDFKFDPQWISQKLQGRVSKQQAESALNLIERLGFIRWDKKLSRYEVQSAKLDIDPKRVSFAIRGFHKECLRVILDALDSEPIERRQVSSVTIALPAAEIEVLKRRVGAFIKEITEEFPASQNLPITDLVQITGVVLQLTEPNSQINRKESDL